jgi:hypothetical protein
MMWILKLCLATLWMAGMIARAGALIHFLALAVVMIVFTEDTWVERRVREFANRHLGMRRLQSSRRHG